MQVNPQGGNEYRELIFKNANAFGLDSALIASVIHQESAGVAFAVRFEPLFYERKIRHLGRTQMAGFVPARIPTLDTERIMRSSSFGLMQILGETARSILGYRGHYLTSLLDPELNVKLGCTLIKRLLARHSATGDGREQLRRALKEYNGGSDYPDKIFDHMTKKSYLYLLETPKT